MRSVSMAPDDAPSVIAMKRVGTVFKEFKSNSSVMIVLEGDQPLGADAHAFYDQMVKKLEADTKHVEHVQDFWGDPLTAAGAQSADGKAAYVQVYLAGNQGEDAGQRVGRGRPETSSRASTPPPGVKVYVTGPAALAADQHIAGDRSLKIIEAVTFARHHRHAAAGLPVDRHRADLMLLMVVLELSARPRDGRLPGLSQHHRAVDVRHQPAGHAGHRGGDRLRHLPDRPISGGARRRRGPRRPPTTRCSTAPRTWCWARA